MKLSKCVKVLILNAVLSTPILLASGYVSEVETRYFVNVVGEDASLFVQEKMNQIQELIEKSWSNTGMTSFLDWNGKNFVLVASRGSAATVYTFEEYKKIRPFAAEAQFKQNKHIPL